MAIKGIFNQPFGAAVDAIRAKVDIPTAKWDDLWKEEHAAGFMVAGAMEADLLADFRAAVDKAISQGTTLEEFQKDFDAIVERYGWSYNGGRNWRSEVIYATNIRTTYQAGRWDQLTDPETLRFYPYLEYRRTSSLEPRSEHLRWNGIILPADHPWWKTHYPPNAWGCKCKVFSAGKRDLARAGKSGPDEAPEIVIDPATGAPEGIGKGWDYNVGEARKSAQAEALDKALARLPEESAAAIRAEVERRIEEGPDNG
ncbi:phage minor head protein [Desulfuromonas sp. TF]|uniref:phage head morphogenesis protein n=1 Tax=Desulfuromonas sp. TF TaxID=1232410 RepID=UPI0004042733|nr:phage minor head protein [Desulfuromonas sp. TF]